MKRLVKRDEATGVETWCHFDSDSGFTFETVQNVDEILKKNKAEANEYRAGSLMGNTQRHQQKVADIPVSVYYEVLARLGNPKDNPVEWRRWLNDYDNRFFRTGGGTI
jgi:hypothetical protein